MFTVAVNGFSHLQAGIATVSLAVIAACEVFRAVSHR